MSARKLLRGYRISSMFRYSFFPVRRIVFDNVFNVSLMSLFSFLWNYCTDESVILLCNLFLILLILKLQRGIDYHINVSILLALLFLMRKYSIECVLYYSVMLIFIILIKLIKRIKRTYIRVNPGICEPAFSLFTFFLRLIERIMEEIRGNRALRFARSMYANDSRRN